jgi:hypothetical protein
MSTNRELVVKVLQSYKDESNGAIARRVLKLYPDRFSDTNPDSLRRWVSKIRKADNLTSSVQHGRNGAMPEVDTADAPPAPGAPAETISQTKDAQDFVIRGYEGEPPSLEEFLAQWKVDTEVWEVERFEVNHYESHTKLRRYDTKFVTKAGYARLEDQHKTVPLWQIKAKLVRRKAYLEAKAAVEGLLEMLKNNPLKYTPIKRKLLTERPLLLEVDLFDLHYGKLTWDEESGTNFDIKIAEEMFMSAIEKIIQQSAKWHGQVDRIVFPVGNDFFNTDNKFGTTTSGTPQQEDTRWTKTLQLGTELILKAINRLRQVAPVDIVIMPGNHDEQRVVQLGITLQFALQTFDDVTVNNSSRSRKYYEYGKCLIGFSHGRGIKPARLMQMMATDEPQMWARTVYREWHLGDIHHKKEVELVGTEEHAGMTVRYLRSLSATDVWHDMQGYAHNVRAAEAFLWDKEDGLIAQFAANLGIT